MAQIYSKRKQFHYSAVGPSKAVQRQVIRDARSIQFPWASFPENVSDWFTTLANSINTKSEFLFLGAMSMTSVLMGPKYSDDCEKAV